MLKYQPNWYVKKFFQKILKNKKAPAKQAHPFGISSALSVLDCSDCVCDLIWAYLGLTTGAIPSKDTSRGLLRDLIVGLFSCQTVVAADYIKFFPVPVVQRHQ